jgi:hypothetical protein
LIVHNGDQILAHEIFHTRVKPDIDHDVVMLCHDGQFAVQSIRELFAGSVSVIVNHEIVPFDGI